MVPAKRGHGDRQPELVEIFQVQAADLRADENLAVAIR